MPQNLGLEKIETVISLRQSNSFDKIAQHLERFEKWNLLYKYPLRSYGWVFTPKGTKSVNAEDAYQLIVFIREGEFIIYLIIPDERFLFKYLDQLSDDSTFIFIKTDLIDGRQHQTYKTSDSAIQLGQSIDGKNYLMVYPSELYEKGVRIN